MLNDAVSREYQQAIDAADQRLSHALDELGPFPDYLLSCPRIIPSILSRSPPWLVPLRGSLPSVAHCPVIRLPSGPLPQLGETG